MTLPEKINLLRTYATYNILVRNYCFVNGKNDQRIVIFPDFYLFRDFQH